MQCCTMTFRRAIGLSIAVHIVLFGSALAFAHYGGSVFSRELRSVTVSLIGAGDEEHKIRRPAPARSRAETITTPAVVQEATVKQELSAPVEAPEEVAPGKVTDPSQDMADGTPGTPTASFGYSPEEWDLLQSALEKAKTYPRFARERGIEGTVLVRFKVRPTGGIERVDVVKSSGAKILDDATVKTIYRAAPVPYVEGWVEVPMVYQLRGAEKR